VRSSAVGEDSEGASFAGQHVTILNVRHEDHVVDAVLRVRESAHTESARAYRRTLGMDEAPRVAVVIQRMIEPECAGVMFTKNPLNGADERVIEAPWARRSCRRRPRRTDNYLSTTRDGCQAHGRRKGHRAARRPRRHGRGGGR
jgi:hypothetical protein